MARHPEDSTRYEQIIEATRDAEGVVHRDEAVKLLAAELSSNQERLAEYATSRAYSVADGFDRTHQPEVDSGQMLLDVDTYLVIGDSERVLVVEATAEHTRQWLDIQNRAKAQHDVAHGIKTLRGYKLLELQVERSCSMWEAAQILAARAG